MQSDGASQHLGMGLFSRAVYDLNGDLLGCVAYTDTRFFDSMFKSGRAFGIIAALCSSILLLFLAVTLFILPKGCEVLWNGSRFYSAAATMGQLFSLLVMNTSHCQKLGNTCHFTPLGKIALVNVAIFATLTVKIFFERMPVQPWIHLCSPSIEDSALTTNHVEPNTSDSHNDTLHADEDQVSPEDFPTEPESGHKHEETGMEFDPESLITNTQPRSSQESITSHTSTDQIVGNVYQRDTGLQNQRSFRFMILFLLLTSWAISIAGIRRCTMFLVGPTEGLRSDYSGLGLFNRAAYYKGTIIGCLAYPEQIQQHFDPVFQISRVFGAITSFLMTAILVLAIVLLFANVAKDEIWLFIRVLLPCATVTQTLVFIGYKTETCSLTPLVECKIGPTGFVVIVNIFLLSMLSITALTYPPPRGPLLRLHRPKNVAHDPLTPQSTTMPLAPLSSMEQNIQRNTQCPNQACLPVIHETSCTLIDGNGNLLNDEVQQLDIDYNTDIDENTGDTVTVRVEHTNSEKKTITTIIHSDGSQTVTTMIEEMIVSDSLNSVECGVTLDSGHDNDEMDEIDLSTPNDDVLPNKTKMATRMESAPAGLNDMGTTSVTKKLGQLVVPGAKRLTELKATPITSKQVETEPAITAMKPWQIKSPATSSSEKEGMVYQKTVSGNGASQWMKSPTGEWLRTACDSDEDPKAAPWIAQRKALRQVSGVSTITATVPSTKEASLPAPWLARGKETKAPSLRDQEAKAQVVQPAKVVGATPMLAVKSTSQPTEVKDSGTINSASVPWVTQRKSLRQTDTTASLSPVQPNATQTSSENGKTITEEGTDYSPTIATKREIEVVSEAKNEGDRGNHSSSSDQTRIKDLTGKVSMEKDSFENPSDTELPDERPISEEAEPSEEINRVPKHSGFTSVMPTAKGGKATLELDADESNDKKEWQAKKSLPGKLKPAPWVVQNQARRESFSDRISVSKSTTSGANQSLPDDVVSHTKTSQSVKAHEMTSPHIADSIKPHEPESNDEAINTRQLDTSSEGNRPPENNDNPSVADETKQWKSDSEDMQPRPLPWLAQRKPLRQTSVDLPRNPESAQQKLAPWATRKSLAALDSVPVVEVGNPCSNPIDNGSVLHTLSVQENTVDESKSCSKSSDISNVPVASGTVDDLLHQESVATSPSLNIPEPDQPSKTLSWLAKRKVDAAIAPPSATGEPKVASWISKRHTVTVSGRNPSHQVTSSTANISHDSVDISTFETTKHASPESIVEEEKSSNHSELQRVPVAMESQGDEQVVTSNEESPDHEKSVQAPVAPWLARWKARQESANDSL